MSASLASSAALRNTAVGTAGKIARSRRAPVTRVFASSRDAAPVEAVELPRRSALALGLAAFASPASPLNIATTSPAFAEDAAETIGTREWDFKTYKLAAPAVYDEVNVPLANPANGVASPTVLLLKDTRPAQAGNTIQLSKQTIPEGGIKSVRDIGTARETAEKLVAAEETRKASNPFNKVSPEKALENVREKVRDAYERTGPGGLVYYTAEYTKTVATVERVIVSTLVVADGTLYTLTAEEDKGRFESEMGDALKACARSFEVGTEGAAAPEPAKKAAPAKKGRK